MGLNKKKRNMNPASKTFSILAFMVVIFTVSEICLATPVPASEDDYGDYVMKERAARKEDVIEDADVVEGSDPIGDIFGDILKGAGALLTEGTKIGVKAISAAPSIIEQKVAFAQGFGKTVQETSGQVKQGFDDVGQQFKVASAFAKTYGEFALEGLADFLQTFARRLKCNTDCQKFKEGSEKRQQCEIENCIELAQLRTVEDIVDDYDYSYGYEDTEEDNEVQVEN